MTALARPWPIRACWAVLPFAVGPALAAGLDHRCRAVALTVAVLAWALWAAGLVAVLVPRTTSLTFLRIAVPLVAVTAGWAVVDASRRGDTSVVDVVAVSVAALLVVVAFLPITGDVFVDGSSYGAERRFALRAPASLYLGPLVVAWALAVAPAAGLLLLASDQLVAGLAVLLVSIPVAVLSVRSLHGLARRWLVFVPAGVVLHDPAALVDPVHVPRGSIVSLGPSPAPPHPEALDLTQGAYGLLVEVVLDQPRSVGRRGRGRSATPHEVSTSRVLIAPTRPGAVLGEAVRRHIRVPTIGTDG